MTLRSSIAGPNRNATALMLGLTALLAAAGSAPLRAEEAPARHVIQRIDMPVSTLRAGAEAAEVERVLGRPTTTTVLEAGAGDSRALVYAEGPVRTQVTITDGHISAIALDLLPIDTASLPAHARMVRPMMMRGGVLALLGRPAADERGTAFGLESEWMLFARAGERDFSILLVDGMVVDVRSGGGERSDIRRLVLPAAIADASAEKDLSIGLSPEQAAPLLGPEAWMATTSTLERQPVLYATHHERAGPRLVSLTYTGGALTAFAFWSPEALDSAESCCSAAAGRPRAENLR